MALLTTQKNQLFKAIEEAGMPVTSFRIEESEGVYAYGGAPATISVRHNHAGYFFQVHWRGGSFSCEWSPGSGELRGYSGNLGSFGVVLLRFKGWLVHLSRELDEPDLWGQLEERMGEAATQGLALRSGANSGFTYAEVTRIEACLDEIRALLVERHPEKQQEIQAQLTYLVEQAKKQPRRDWFFLTIGALIGLASDIDISRDDMRLVFERLKQTVSDFLPLITG